jgi:hypothetical protein
VGAAAVILRITLKSHRRRQWESKARESDPPSECTTGRMYCQVETKIAFKLASVGAITFTTVDPSTGLKHSRPASRPPVEELDRAIRFRLVGETADRVQARIDSISMQVFGEITRFMQETPHNDSVEAIARLENLKSKTAFTLYRCTETPAGPRWRKMDLWEKEKSRGHSELLLSMGELEFGLGRSPANEAYSAEPTDDDSQRLYNALVEGTRQFVEVYSLKLLPSNGS